MLNEIFPLVIRCQREPRMRCLSTSRVTFRSARKRCIFSSRFLSSRLPCLISNPLCSQQFPICFHRPDGIRGPTTISMPNRRQDGNTCLWVASQVPSCHFLSARSGEDTEYHYYSGFSTIALWIAIPNSHWRTSRRSATQHRLRRWRKLWIDVFNSWYHSQPFELLPPRQSNRTDLSSQKQPQLISPDAQRIATAPNDEEEATWWTTTLIRSKKSRKNIQHRGFAGRHRPNY